MSSPKCLHICSEDVKFIVPFINFVKSNYDINDHKFLFLSAEGRELLNNEPTANNICSAADIFKYIKDIYKSDKIILHALMSKKLVLFLALQPWLLKKCYWIIWGRDLYAYQKHRSGIKAKINEALRAFVIKRLGHIVTFIDGDFRLAKKWYATKAQYHPSFVYQSNIFKDMSVKPKAHEGMNILLGNSAHAENNHSDVFKQLERYKDENIHIYAPLTYGNEAYKEQVIAEGKSMFGEKFTPLTEFMPFEKYVEFLGSIDIAIFAHDRQQAMGNIISLSGLGKTIYLKDNHTLWERFTGLGIKFFNLKDLQLKMLDEESRVQNGKLVREIFSEKTLLESLGWMSE